jgi:uncharacterized protein YbjQ (UPF0145 family)
MLCVTTPTISRREIISYSGIVATEVIEGADALADLSASMRDAWGGRSKTYENLFAKSRLLAIAELQEQASKLGANAIVNVKFAFQVLGEKGQMLMVAATGTAVVIVKTDQEKRADELFQLESEPDFFVQIKGQEKGPFSLTQIRELVRNNTLNEDSELRSERRGTTMSLSDFLAR